MEKSRRLLQLEMALGMVKEELNTLKFEVQAIIQRERDIKSIKDRIVTQQSLMLRVEGDLENTIRVLAVQEGVIEVEPENGDDD